MARPVAAPIIQTTALRNLQPGVSIANLPRTDGGVISVADVTQGMVKNLPRDQVPAGSAREIINGRIRDDWCGRREGTAEVGSKPDSNKVIGVFSIVLEGGERLVCRVSQSTFHVWSGSAWTAYTVTGGFKGSATRVSAAQLFGKMYISFDINDGLWEVDFNSKTLTQVSEAPGGKFAITFAERILLGNIFISGEGHKPNAVAWSANSDPQDWDGESAGQEDLIADSLGNQIFGLEALANLAVIVRRRSLVHVTRQPFAIAPFRFDTIITGVGSDLPYTTVGIPGGVIFADSRTQDVYLYRPGSFPQSLTQGARHVHGLLFEDLAQAVHSQAAWDPYEGEYHLGLVWTTDNELITRRWICKLHRGQPVWSYDDSPTISCIGSVLPPTDGTTIDELSGTINTLSGSIDGLSSRTIPQPRIHAGVSTGEVIEFSYDNDDEWDATEFDFTFSSPNVGSQEVRRTMKDLEVNCEIPTSGSVTVEQSKDESTWTNTKTESRIGSSGFQKVRLPRTPITGNDLFWRIVTNAPGFKIYNWWARLMDKGPQFGTQQ